MFTAVGSTVYFRANDGTDEYPASRLIAQKFYSAIPVLSAPHQLGGPAYPSVYKTWAWQLYASPECVAAVKSGNPLAGIQRN